MIPFVSRRSPVYLGTGGTATYGFAFKVFSKADIAVQVTDTSGHASTLALDTNYTVALNADQDNFPGGSITLTAGALAAGYSLVVVGAQDYSQTTQLPTGGAYNAVIVERAMDRIMVAAQQLKELADRSLKLPVSEPLSSDLVAAATRLDRVLGFNLTTGQPEVSTFTMTQVASVIAAIYTAAAGPLDALSFLQSGTGAVSRSAQAKLRELVTTDDFGCDRTGVTNTTTKLKNFFDYCIASGRPGRILAGTYKVTTGVLAFDTPFVDAIWPEISTDGHQAVIFSVDAATATNAPIISLTNGVATSQAGRYWRGGSLGGITFTDATGAVAAARHGLSLRGVWGCRFGWMVGNDLRGSLISIPQSLYAGNNPDPYAVSFPEFEGIEANRCQRYAIENQNWVGLAGAQVKVLRVIECVLGGWYGLGAGNRCYDASMGSVKGWAFDDGTNTSNLGGSPSRFRLDLGELDDVQNGFRLNKLTLSDFGQTRFVHRYNFSSLNPGEGYWPRKAVQFNGGAAPASLALKMELHHRIEAGGLKANMGAFLDFSSIGATNVTVEQRVIDNAGFGFTDGDLYTNANSNSTVVLTRDGIVIADRRSYSALLARGDGTTAIGNTGYGSATAKVPIPVEAYDLGGNYAASEYTAPYAGLFRFVFRFALDTGAAGTRIRMGIMLNRGGGLQIVAHRTLYSVAAGTQHYEITGVIDLLAGDIVYPIADQNTATASIACTPVSAQAAENVFQMNSVY